MNTLKEQLNETKKLWWLHDSYWHATMVKEFGAEKANQLNLEANERFFRKYTLLLLRSGAIQRPESIEDLMEIFKTVWSTCFFDEMYVNEPVTIKGNMATWTGHQCNAFDSLNAAKMTKGYACGCQAIRNGVMKALRLKPVHSIEESLVHGDGRCVITFCFEPK
ncbi:hypothetical protein [Desulforhopalus sp. IMCC35007]|uniref:hypothetical protein n=1 Tax=Desulforhopalus sp. IMCC35007 TaxID=2569543 RepID=UPI0010AEBBE8|nr:hypothetical protein [Desulforhopalus sp. IMCC35007]TKB05758.1 hypothetical protein FCL48_23775 [Desulforhopalus sp. IMCC35007]